MNEHRFQRMAKESIPKLNYDRILTIALVAGAIANACNDEILIAAVSDTGTSNLPGEMYVQIGRSPRKGLSKE